MSSLSSQGPSWELWVLLVVTIGSVTVALACREACSLKPVYWVMSSNEELFHMGCC